MKTVKKQILRYGHWEHPAAPKGLNVTPEYVQTIVKNFQHTPFVPVLRGHVENSDAEKDPSLVISKNIKQLEADDKGLNAVFEVEDNELEKYNDVSARIDEEYTNHETGDPVGATLKHIAMVLDPYIKGLNTFVQATDRSSYLINLSDIHSMTDKKESKTELEDQTVEKKVEETVETPVEATKTETVEAPKEVVEEKKEDVKPTETPKEVVDSTDLQKKIIQLQEDLRAKDAIILKANAEAKYIELRDAGKATPAMEEAVKALFQTPKTTINLADGSEKTLDVLLNDLFEKMPKLIQLGEIGKNIETSDEKEAPNKAQLIEMWKKQDITLTDEQAEKRYEANLETIKTASEKYK